MSKYVGITLCLVLALGSFPSTSRAAPAEHDPLYAGIAACLGRYSAQVEYAHLMGENADEVTERRADFNQLYDALDGNRGLLSLRISHKAQHARLLQIATFNTNPRHRRLAARQAQQQIASCRGMTLS